MCCATNTNSPCFSWAFAWCAGWAGWADAAKRTQARVVLLYLQQEERSANFASSLQLWLAMFCPVDALVCYTCNSGPLVRLALQL